MEILTTIFRLQEPDKFWFGSRWVGLMLVCHKWREILLKDGYMWSFITNRASKPCHELSIVDRAARAGTHPLTCELHFARGHSHQTAAAFCVIQTYSDRISYLELWNPSPRALDLVLGDLTSFPALRQLDIDSIFDTVNMWRPPHSLFQHGFPLLADLRVNNFEIPPLRHMPLTHISLSSRWHQPQPVFNDFWAWLADWPSLVSLELWDPCTRVEHISLPQLTLPALRSLCLMGNGHDLLKFFEQTSITTSLHPECKIKAETFDTFNTNTLAIAIYDVIRPLFHSPGYRPFTSVRLQYGADRDSMSCVLSLWNDSHPDESDRANFSIMFNIGPFTVPTAPHEVYAPFLRRLPWASRGVQVHLQMNTPMTKVLSSHVHSVVCRDIFNYVPIDAVSLLHTGAVAFLEALLLRVRTAHAPTHLTFLLPQIIVRGSSKFALDVGRISSLIEQIAKHGKRVPALTFQNCPGDAWAADVVVQVATSGVAEHVQRLEFKR